MFTYLKGRMGVGDGERKIDEEREWSNLLIYFPNAHYNRPHLTEMRSQEFSPDLPQD